MANRIWIAFANANKCRHTDAIYNLGFINWAMDMNKFQINDIVYLFMSNTRSIQFKMIVSEENCERLDSEYWFIPPVHSKTYKLIILKEYKGNLLNEENLIKNGFKGGKSLQHPIYSNSKLIKYVNSIFDKEEGVEDFHQGLKYYEGEIKIRKHKEHERNREVVELAKLLFKQKYRHLFCEICGFDFEKTYGKRGLDFIEAHHTIPISTIKLGHEIKTNDFTMVCSNCHSMLHKYYEGKLPTIEELKDKIHK